MNPSGRQWMMCALPRGVTMELSYYCLRDGFTHGPCTLTWELQGYPSDNGEWEEHARLMEEAQASLWTVQDSERPAMRAVLEHLQAAAHAHEEPKWVTLRSHAADPWLEGGRGMDKTSGWPVEVGKGAFSRFRVINEGGNLVCSGIELYGTLLGYSAESTGGFQPRESREARLVRLSK